MFETTLRKVVSRAFSKEIDEEVIMLTHAFQGKLGPRVKLNVSQEALKIFKEKLKNGEI